MRRQNLFLFLIDMRNGINSNNIINMIELMISCGLNINELDKYGNFPIVHVLALASPKIVEYIINHASLVISCVTVDILNHAVNYQKKNIISHLYERFQLPIIYTNSVPDAIMTAIKCNKTDVYEYLKSVIDTKDVNDVIEHGMIVNGWNTYETSA
eukprot:Pompholyxophrys_sp_v1_NODE_4_length_15125_cov_6.573656.p9 type:complete len:156 gc:universal NODE_4_length_15125_cov_6.573656:10640-10173(-)